MVYLSHNLSILIQGRNEGTSSVAFEVLIINCQIDFINLFIFNCLTLNIKLFIFKLFDFKFLFSENHLFRKQKRTTIYGLTDVRPQFRILNSPGKMMTPYLCEINKFLRYRTLCKSILKRGFPTEGIKLTCFVLFEVLGVPQLQVLGLDHFSRFGKKICEIQVRLWNKRFQRA